MYAFCVYFMHIIVLSCMFIPVEIYAIVFADFKSLCVSNNTSLFFNN